MTMGQNYPKVEAILKKQIEKNKTPGLQYVVIKNNKVVYEYYGGTASFKENSKVNENSIFKIFSATKTFTALAVMQLAEQGKLQIDDSVSQYVDFYPFKEEITIKQLLSHTSGISNPLPVWIHFKDDHENFNYKNFRKEIFEKYPSLKRKPGKKRAYSNVGYLYLAEIIETVSGMSFNEYINANIIDKLNIPEKFISFEIPDNNFAYGHHKAKGLLSNFVLKFFQKNKLVESTYGKWYELTKHFYLNGPAYGGLHANALSLAKYGNEILNKNTNLININSFNLMLTPVNLNNGQEISQCLSWMKRKLKNEDIFWHAGGGGGYSCDFRIYPDQNMVSVVMMNRTQKIKDLKFLDKIDYIFFE